MSTYRLSPTAAQSPSQQSNFIMESRNNNNNDNNSNGRQLTRSLSLQQASEIYHQQNDFALKSTSPLSSISSPMKASPLLNNSCATGAPNNSSVNLSALFGIPGISEKPPFLGNETQQAPSAITSALTWQQLAAVAAAAAAASAQTGSVNGNNTSAHTQQQAHAGGLDVASLLAGVGILSNRGSSATFGGAGAPAPISLPQASPLSLGGMFGAAAPFPGHPHSLLPAQQAAFLNSILAASAASATGGSSSSVAMSLASPPTSTSTTGTNTNSTTTATVSMSAAASAAPPLGPHPSALAAAAAAVAANPHPSMFHAAGGDRAVLMESWESWRQFQQAAYANNLDPHLLAYYHNAGCAMDLGNAPRRKNATRETTSMLKAWLNEHRKNPYPTKGEKIMLAIITKMTLTQVSTWFANARRRLKKENKMTWSPRNRAEEEEEDDDDDSDAGTALDESEREAGGGGGETAGQSGNPDSGSMGQQQQSLHEVPDDVSMNEDIDVTDSQQSLQQPPSLFPGMVGSVHQLPPHHPFLKNASMHEMFSSAMMAAGMSSSSRYYPSSMPHFKGPLPLRVDVPPESDTSNGNTAALSAAILRFNTSMQEAVLNRSAGNGNNNNDLVKSHNNKSTKQNAGNKIWSIADMADEQQHLESAISNSTETSPEMARSLETAPATGGEFNIGGGPGYPCPPHFRHPGIHPYKGTSLPFHLLSSYAQQQQRRMCGSQQPENNLQPFMFGPPGQQDSKLANPYEPAQSRSNVNGPSSVASAIPPLNNKTSLNLSPSSYTATMAPTTGIFNPAAVSTPPCNPIPNSQHPTSSAVLLAAQRLLHQHASTGTPNIPSKSSALWNHLFHSIGNNVLSTSVTTASRLPDDGTSPSRVNTIAPSSGPPTLLSNSCSSPLQQHIFTSSSSPTLTSVPQPVTTSTTPSSRRSSSSSNASPPLKVVINTRDLSISSSEDS